MTMGQRQNGAIFYILPLFILQNWFLLCSCISIDDIIYYNVIKEIKRIPPTHLHVQNFWTRRQENNNIRRRQAALVRPSGYRDGRSRGSTDGRIVWGDEGPVETTKITGPTINFGRPPPPPFQQAADAGYAIPRPATYRPTTTTQPPGSPASYGQNNAQKPGTTSNPFAALFRFNDEPEPVPPNPFVKKLQKVRKVKQAHTPPLPDPTPSKTFLSKSVLQSLRHLQEIATRSNVRGRVRSRDSGARCATANCGGADKSECADKHDKCALWAREGECRTNAFWMKPNCQNSCNSCGVTVETVRPKVTQFPGCTNNHKLCEFWASDGECKKNVSFMAEDCRLSCQLCAS